MEHTRTSVRTFAFHAGLEALAEAAVLTLVAVMLVDGAGARRTARVGEVAAHRALEEALASLARVLPVMLARALVSTDHALRRGLLLLMMMVVVMSDATVWNALEHRYTACPKNVPFCFFLSNNFVKTNRL